MEKYFNKKKYNSGEIISDLITDVINKNKYTSILFIRTPPTGGWLDNFLKNNKNIIRILYKTQHHNKKTKILAHPLTKIINSEELEHKLKTFNKTFDLICVDPFHEYEYSKRDFFLLSSYLTDNGMIISHDCFPKNEAYANPKFNPGAWSGETYIALVEFAYNNPEYFYGIIELDTGIGIISKKEFNGLTNKLNKDKQKELLLLHKNSDKPYEYFCNNGKEIINTINILPKRL